jgi:hypothetical protein
LASKIGADFGQLEQLVVLANTNGVLIGQFVTLFEVINWNNLR